MASALITYKNKHFAAKMLFAFSLLLSGCTVSDQVQVQFDRVQDFKKSEIISNGPMVADGQSELLVVIQLMNSDGSSVKLFKPTYEVVAGTGVIAQACTTSNDNGVSTCVLKSVQAGTKTISVTNIKFNLKADIVFSAPVASKALSGLISAKKNQSQGNFEISATIGNQETGVVKTGGAFKVYGGVQGEAFSR